MWWPGRISPGLLTSRQGQGFCSTLLPGVPSFVLVFQVFPLRERPRGGEGAGGYPWGSFPPLGEARTCEPVAVLLPCGISHKPLCMLSGRAHQASEASNGWECAVKVGGNGVGAGG